MSPCSAGSVAAFNRLAVLLLLAVSLSHALDVTWVSPVAGDVYGPGDYIVGEWQSDTEVASPTFQLCIASASANAGNASRCGSPVATPVQQDPDSGAFQITLTAPNITQTDSYFLEMLDIGGNTTLSPMFTLTSGQEDATGNSTAPSPPLTTTSDSGSQASSGTKSSLQDSQQPQSPFMEQTRMPAPTAAYAVPLALAGTIILAASIVGIHQYRKLLQERREEKERLAQSTDRGARRMGLGSPMSSFRTVRSDKSAGSFDTVSTMPEKSDIYTRMYVPTGDRGRYPVPTPGNERERERTREAFRKREVHGYPSTPAHTSHHAPPNRTPHHPTSDHTPAHTRVPVGVFRSAMSPHIPPTTPKPRRRGDVEAQMNAGVSDTVLSHYLRPSPVPGYLASPSQAHVRRAAAPSPSPADAALYNAVERRLYRTHREQR